MRHLSIRHLLVIAILALGLLPGMAPLASAQELPTAREQSATLREAGFPDASDLGTGWSLLQAFSYPADDSATFASYEAAYADRYGTRVQMFSAAYDRQSEADALAFTQYLIGRDQDNVLPSDAAPSARELRALEDPNGCEEVLRATGEEPLMYFYIGSITCQDTSNDRAIWVMLSGVYEGDNFQEGAEAILEIVLETTPR